MVDERLKTIDKIFDKVHEYNNKHDCGQILFWSLCQFEKRKQSKGELDYYIANYGYLVYDSKKDIDVDEKIKVTNYAGVMDYYRFAKKHLVSNRNDVWMEKLLEPYIAKIGYFFEERLLELNELIEYVRYISSDETIENLIEKYLNEKDDKQKVEICKEFEKYLKTVKQNRIKYKLENIPTMKVYERKKALYEKNGVLDINTLTKEDEYIMYVLEKKHISEIAKLYGVDSTYIGRKNNGWNIRIRAMIASDEKTDEEFRKEVVLQTYKDEQAIKYIDSFKNLIDFEKCIDLILDFMEPDEVYLLKEFWKFTNYEKSDYEKLSLEKTRQSRSNRL